jgi:hypothetical protein
MFPCFVIGFCVQCGELRSHPGSQIVNKYLFDQSGNVTIVYLKFAIFQASGMASILQTASY